MSAPARTTFPSDISCTNTPSPSSPYTTDGTPARLDMLTSMICVSRFFGAYSSRYMAAPTPIGTVKMAVNAIVIRVPMTAAFTPANSGCLDI